MPQAGKGDARPRGARRVATVIAAEAESGPGIAIMIVTTIEATDATATVLSEEGPVAAVAPLDDPAVLVLALVLAAPGAMTTACSGQYL